MESDHASPGLEGPAGESPDGEVRELRADAAKLGRELGGDLPCVMCGYNLRGLSIRGVCPECGAGVRATILSVIDPQASVLQPIPRPRLVAGGLMVWCSMLLLAALTLWWLVLGDTTRRFGAPPPRDLGAVIPGLIALAALGAAALVRPHGGTPAWYSLAVLGAVALHAPLAWCLRELAVRGWSESALSTLTLIGAMGCLVAIFLLIRPTARLLVARSLLLRSGKVDRQTLLGMSAAAMIVAIGQGVWRLAIVGGSAVMAVLGLVLLVAGGALLTLGLAGAVVDSLRIARAILRPRRTLGQVLDGGTGPVEAPAVR